LEIFDSSSVTFASYLVSVRQTSALPSASFRFHLTADTLAVRLAVPLAGPALDFNQLVSAPCRAHKEKSAPGGAAEGTVIQHSFAPSGAADQRKSFTHGCAVGYYLTLLRS
jgi:hypothetical protein